MIQYCTFCVNGKIYFLFITQKRKTFCYVDYDQTTGAEDVMQSAASLTWPGAASSTQSESDVCSIRCARESVSYEDDDNAVSQNKKQKWKDAADPQIIRGKFYNSQFDATRASSTLLNTALSRYEVEH